MRGVSFVLLLAVPAWGHINPWLRPLLNGGCGLKLRASAQTPTPVPVDATKVANPIPDDPGASFAELAHKLSETAKAPETRPLLPPEKVHNYPGQLDLSWTSNGKDGKPYVAYGKCRYGDIIIYADKDIVSMKIIQKDPLKLGQVLDGDAIAYLVHFEKNLKQIPHAISKVKDVGFEHMAYPNIDLEIRPGEGADPIFELNKFFVKLFGEVPRHRNYPAYP